LKICTKCKISKDESEYYKDKSRKDGLYSLCTNCARAHQKKYKEDKKNYMKVYNNLLEIKERAKEYNKTNKDIRRATARIYQENNRELISKRKREYNQKNKDKIRESKKKYLEMNPWIKTYKYIRTRCNNKNTNGYKNYGGRGIKCLITKEELKNIWVRDKAYLLQQPSIDRMDNDGHYKYSNCQYIEFEENKKKRHLDKINNNLIKTKEKK